MMRIGGGNLKDVFIITGKVLGTIAVIAGSIAVSSGPRKVAKGITVLVAVIIIVCIWVL